MSPTITSSRSRFGTSMPIADLPGIGAIRRTSGEPSAYAMSSASRSTCDTFTPDAELDLVARDRRAARHRRDGRVDAEVLQRALEDASDLLGAAADFALPSERRKIVGGGSW